ncbi:MAG: hypothetical protein KBD63_04715 [Bacteriovoracaceae bacterium]|nr:hypothetical protein [Bacteriovoracaceae bacterium]
MSLFSIELCAVTQNKNSWDITPCVQADFEVKASHPSFMGLLKDSIQIKKEKCQIFIEQKKFFSSHYLIDICRTPIHIKEGKSYKEVLKRERNCGIRRPSTNSKDVFCEAFFDVNTFVEEKGLVFATGDRNDLTSDHGKFYCTSELLNYYLGQGKVLDATSTEPLMIPIRARY